MASSSFSYQPLQSLADEGIIDHNQLQQLQPDHQTAVTTSSTQPITSTSSSPPPQLSQSTQPRTVIGSGSDGVFSHMQALPSTSSSNNKGFEEFEPPSYQEVVSEQAPPYMEATVVTEVTEDGDILVEGVPVGDFFTFFVYMIVSMSFDFIGFLMTSMLATSHAAKQGARSGLGITLIRYGFLLKAKSAEAEMEAYRYDPENFQVEEQVAVQNEYVAYTMMVLGFFLLLRANAEFIRAQRLKAAILATSSDSHA